MKLNVFLHENSGCCRYGALCERKYCMYKHDDDKCDKELVNERNESEDCGNRTFQKPSQIDKILSDETFQCDWCDFISERKSNLEKHQEISKIWCSFCSDSWGCEDNLNIHMEMEHQQQQNINRISKD